MKIKLPQQRIVNDSPFSIIKNPEKYGIGPLYVDRYYNVLNYYSLFIGHFKTIPNVIYESEIDCENAIKWFTTTYGSEIKDYRYTNMKFEFSNKTGLDDVLFYLFDDVIVIFDCNLHKVKILFFQTEPQLVNQLHQGFCQWKHKALEPSSELVVLVSNNGKIDKHNISVNPPTLCLEANYNDDFSAVNDLIVKSLQAKDEKGLILLHGKPGTGKTSYIRYLASKLRKDIIFLPPAMASIITHPNLISVLLDSPNSVFVIEDAERIIIRRDQEENSPVSAILNITDGLLADALNIHIICSFNTDISKIDPALMRKGRLVTKYEFKELTVDKAQRLSNALGFETTVNEPMTLAAIYHQNDKDFAECPKGKPIGFSSL